MIHQQQRRRQRLWIAVATSITFLAVLKHLQYQIPLLPLTLLRRALDVSSEQIVVSSPNDKSDIFIGPALNETAELEVNVDASIPRLPSATIHEIGTSEAFDTTTAEVVFAPTSTSASTLATSHHAKTQISKDGSCQSMDALSDIAVIVKTGSTEIYDRLPIYFATTFTCLEDYLIFSDFDQVIGSHRIYNALANVSWDRMSESEEDAKQYVLLQQHLSSGGAASELKANKQIESWNLDKYKFLPMISQSYARYSEKRWFVFIEADTYLSLHNLLLWLPRFERDHGQEEAIYAGSCVLIGDLEFAHGGSGWLMSSSAARAVSEVYASETLHWEDRLLGDCCGDKVLAEVLQDRSVNPITAYPSIQGETPASLDWSSDKLCKPAITWHHVSAGEIDQLWQFEQRWRRDKGPNRPALFRDYFNELIRPRIDGAENSKISDWDNLSSEWVFASREVEESDADEEHEYNEAVESPEKCEEFCRAQEQCLQWVWQPKWCRANKVIRFGWSVKNRPQLGSADDRVMRIDIIDGDEKPVSGWLMDRIDAFMASAGQCDVEG